MAVRDEERQPYDAAEWNGRNLPWGDALGHLPAVLIASGLILYGYLSLGYYSFYGRLGVDPNDVGLSYAGTLTRSSGFAVTCLLGVIFLLPPPFLQRRPRVERKLSRVPNGAQRVFAVAILSTAMGLMLGWAHGAAARVEDGVPVRPIHLPGPLLSTFILLAIHADPAYVEPAGKPGEFPAVERLRQEGLLYLGQSTGTVVLYDPAAQEAVYVPAGSIVLHVSNCSDEPPEPLCSP
jgi:hypothetical protein